MGQKLKDGVISIIVPKAANNWVWNPSLELWDNDLTPTTPYNWEFHDAGDGDNALSRSSIAIFGRYGARIDGVTGAPYIKSIPTTHTLDDRNSGDWYTASVWVYIPSDAPRIGAAKLTVTAGTDTTATTVSTGLGWQRMSVVIKPISNYFTFYLYLNYENGYVVFDGAQMEKGEEPTTYLDGSLGDGHKWLGVHHTSASKRDSVTRTGGKELNLSSFYDVFIVDGGMNGVGMPPIDYITQQYAFEDGVEMLDYRVKPRNFSLKCMIPSVDLKDLHESRRNLIDALKADLSASFQPVLLRYTNDERQVEIKCFYNSGLEFFKQSGVYHEDFSLGFMAPDPYWYNIHNSIDLLDPCYRDIGVDGVEDPDPAIGLIARRDGAWDRLNDYYVGGSLGGLAPYVLCSAVAYDGTIYFGGTFSFIEKKIGGTVTKYANGIIGWDGQNFFTLGADGIHYDGVSNGCNNRVNCIVTDAQGNVYIGGHFTRTSPTQEFVTGGLYMKYAAKWNKNDGWSPIKGGFDTDVRCMEIASNNRLVMGGSMNHIYNSIDTGTGTQTGDNIIRRCVSLNLDTDAIEYFVSPSGVKQGLNSNVNTITITHDLTVYLGGEFTAVVDMSDVTVTSMFYMAKWQGGRGFQTMLSSGVGMNGPVFCSKLDKNETLYVGGGFSAPSKYITKYNGQGYFSLGPGVNGAVRDIDIQPDGIVYAVGDFTYAGYVAVYHAARWNDYVWTNVDIYLPNSDHTHTVLVHDGNAYFGYQVHAESTQRVAKVSNLLTVTNNGSTYTRPTFIFQNPSNTKEVLWWIENHTTDQRIYMTHGVLPGEVLTLDMQTNIPTVQSNKYGNLARDILPASDFANFRIAPGDNIISVFITRPGTNERHRITVDILGGSPPYTYTLAMPVSAYATASSISVSTADSVATIQSKLRAFFDGFSLSYLWSECVITGSSLDYIIEFKGPLANMALADTVPTFDADDLDVELAADGDGSEEGASEGSSTPKTRCHIVRRERNWSID